MQTPSLPPSPPNPLASLFDVSANMAITETTMMKVSGAANTYDAYARTSVPVASVSVRADDTVSSDQHYARVGLMAASELGCIDAAST